METKSLNNLLEKPREPSGELLAQCQTDDPALGHGPYYFYHFDELGSTRAITHQDGYVVATYDYDAYGKVIHTTGSFQQPYQYVGQLGYYTHHQAPEFGWLQLGVRFYEPELGRFERRDPDAGSAFPYLYADGNALTFVDEDGYRPKRPRKPLPRHMKGPRKERPKKVTPPTQQAPPKGRWKRVPFPYIDKCLNYGCVIPCGTSLYQIGKYYAIMAGCYSGGLRGDDYWVCIHDQLNEENAWSPWANVGGAVACIRCLAARGYDKLVWE